MRRFFILISLFLYAQLTWSQNTVTGKVIRAEGETPIANANVFVPNTSKGTRTDVEGNFSLENVPIGNYEIIISSVGFNTITYSYTATQLPLRLLIKMEVKVQKEETAIVKAFEKDGWAKWGSTFLDSYLGTTENRAFCEVLNKEVLKFRFSKKENVLEVVATDIIIIKNKKLGYLIKHQLEGFEINFSQKTTINYGYPYFEETDTKRKNKLKKYEKERLKAYNGSLMHLMRSVFKDSVTEQGFVIRDLQKIENFEKKRVKAILQNQYKKMLADSTKPITNKITLQIETSDSSTYYSKVMRQPDFFDILGKSFTAKDICFTDSATVISKIMTFPHQLYVEYKKEKQDEKYYAFQLGKQRTPYQTTSMFFNTETRKIDVYENGSFFNPLDIFLDGYMAWEKMADLLPLDYEMGD